MIHIQVDKQYWSVVKSSELRRAAKAAGIKCNFSNDADFTIVISGDDQVRALNKVFRNIDDTTDVLSFQSEERDPETGRKYLGDIIISYPRAFEQAENAGHTVQDELCLLVIHGVLHLAGHDHASLDEEKSMFSMQDEILGKMKSKMTFGDQ